MQWGFLVLALLAALGELHTGTFYLAAVATAALLAALLGFWLPDPMLILAFAAIAAALILVLALTSRRRRSLWHDPLDLDAGESVTVLEAPGPDGTLGVLYRGTRWRARMEEGQAPPAGAQAVIRRRRDKLLLLATLPPRPGNE